MKFIITEVSTLDLWLIYHCGFLKEWLIVRYFLINTFIFVKGDAYGSIIRCYRFCKVIVGFIFPLLSYICTSNTWKYPHWKKFKKYRKTWKLLLLHLFYFPPQRQIYYQHQTLFFSFSYLHMHTCFVLFGWESCT